MPPIRPFQLSDLEPAAALAPHRRPELLAHLRWCLYTPYAEAFVHQHEGALRGFVTSLSFAGSATLRELVAAPATSDILHELLHFILEHHTRHGRTSVVYTAPLLCHPEPVEGWHPDIIGGPTLEAAGFQPRETLLLFQGGHFIQATHEEVELITPAHTLGLLHMDRQVSGQDRAPLLLEHRFAAQAWVQDGKVEGFLLPTLGRGLVVANTPTVGLELQRWLLPHQHEVLVPATNTAACEHLKERGYTGTIFGVRMEYGDPLAVDAQRLFGVGW